MTHDPGPEPELAWLPVDRLSVDHTYQRTLESRRSQRTIERIAGDFKWAAFQAILAAPDGKDGWLVLDGQHRVEAAKRRGIARVPAVVVDAPSTAEQANAFVTANMIRVAVNPFALHHASIAAGDELAVQVARACALGGVEIPRYPLQVSRLKPGQTLALGSVQAMVRRLGVETSGKVLRAISTAWKAHPGQLRASLIRAAADLVAETPELERIFTVVELEEKLRKTNPVTLFIEAEALRHEREIHEWAAVKAVLQGAKSNPLRKPMPRPALVLPSEADTPFDEPKQRRCEGCNRIFAARRSSEVRCPRCTPGGARG